MYEQKPPYKLHPIQHVLWALLGLLTNLIPFFMFGIGSFGPFASSFRAKEDSNELVVPEGEEEQQTSV